MTLINVPEDTQKIDLINEAHVKIEGGHRKLFRFMVHVILH